MHLLENSIDLLFLLGQDKLSIQKKGLFVVYIGSHGDEGAKNSDLILPGSAFTEQDGYYTNLEGKIQKAFKASYPTELAKEDWLILNEIANVVCKKYLFKNKEDLVDNMFNYLNQERKEEFIKTDYILENENIFIPKKSKHRLENNNNEDLIIIEIQYGSDLREDDIIRYDDIYDRI